MSGTISVSLGGRSYTVRRFTIGQLETLFTTDWPRGKFGFAVLRLALERAEPKPESAVAELEIGADEMRSAIAAILDFSGLRQLAPGEAEAEAPERT